MAGEVADQPGFWASLGDNALTRAWATAMDRHLIGPVERMGMDDEVMRQKMAAMVADRLPDDGKLSVAQLKALGVLKGEAANAEALQAALGSAGDARRHLGDQAYTLMLERATPRDRIGQAAALLADGRTGFTHRGDDVRQFLLGSPVAAYSAVTAGGALATQAGIDGYEWLMAQQQAEKESQLPLA